MSDLTGLPKFTSIVLTWSAPQEPNGVIISYEVTYRVSDGNNFTTNTTDLSTTITIPSLTPGTNVTEISVSAYTSAGRGELAPIFHIMTFTAPRELYHNFRKFNAKCMCIIIAMVVNTMIEIVSSTSVRVSWDRLDIPEITGYIVYYSQTGNSEMVTTTYTEQSITVSNSTNFVVVPSLVNSAEYQFEVVAVAELNGEGTVGQRSATITARVVAPPISTTIGHKESEGMMLLLRCFD